jgi:hypothetical protein
VTGFKSCSLFVWLVADGWCWFVPREKYRWLVAGGWFVLREKYCWLVADKTSEQGVEWSKIPNFGVRWLEPNSSDSSMVKNEFFQKKIM